MINCISQRLKRIMQPAEAFEPEQQAAELILPAKHALNGIEAFLEYVSIERRLPAKFGEFPPPGIGIDVGHHAAVEDRLPILPAIVNPSRLTIVPRRSIPTKQATRVTIGKASHRSGNSL